MKITNTITVLFFLIILNIDSTKAQIGINTVNPAATLDINGKPAIATELDGVIPPRITGAQLRAKTYTTNQTAAIVYVTAADTAPAGQTVNITVPGHFYFDGTVWIALIPAGDGDFFKVGTTKPPTLITEDVWRTGKVAIGKTVPSFALDVISGDTENTAVKITKEGALDGKSFGLEVTESSKGLGAHTGIRSIVSYDVAGSATDRHIGLYTSVQGKPTSGTNKNENIGIYNALEYGSGSHTGFFNSMAGTENSKNVGMDNYITNSGNGDQKGISNQLKLPATIPPGVTDTGTGDKYGVYNNIKDSKGNNYGTWNEVGGAITSKISIGTFNKIISTNGTNIGGYFTASSTDTTPILPVANNKYYAAIFNKGAILLKDLPSYLDNTAAGSLEVGQLYRTPSGVLMVKF